jgi:hypothetical protein
MVCDRRKYAFNSTEIRFRPVRPSLFCPYIVNKIELPMWDKTLGNGASLNFHRFVCPEGLLGVDKFLFSRSIAGCGLVNPVLPWGGPAQ